MADNLHATPHAYLIPLPVGTFSTSIPLDPGVVTIGRRRSNTIHLANGSVSRNHARISLEDGQYVLSDLESRNGTYVNKKRIKNIPLKHDDRIAFGGCSFVFSLEDPEPDDTNPTYTSIEDTIHFLEDDAQLPEMVESKAEIAAQTFLDPKKGRKDISPDQLINGHDRLLLLYQLIDKLRYEKNIDEILRMGTDLIFSALHSAERCVVMLRPSSKEPLEARIVKNRHQNPDEDGIPVSQTIINKVIKEKVALVSRDALEDSRFETGESIMVHNLKSLICVPLFTGRKVNGVVHIDSSMMIDSFNQYDLEFVAAIANEMSITIDNSRLQHEALQNERMAAIGLTITNIAHNIRNMLTINKGVEEVMSMQVSQIGDEKLVKIWSLIRKSLEQINNLSSNMLDFTRVHPFKLDLCDINSTVLKYREFFEENLSRKGIKLEMDLDPNLPKWVMNESGLKRALLNLVVNANDAIKGKEDGIITISTFADAQNHLNINVSDNGCGVEPDKIKNIFQLFFTTKGTKGSGLGLPMVQRFAERLGGTITAKSKVNEGSTFTLNIPWIEDKE
ncbi:MAG: FHA domain-containing protein [Desulfobacterales bacterium]|nr:FHA domain-containing protein [Deltaproteobacteria bacterium]NNL41842.1 FHA domain-containing protein [Desulfobacterales bacterium]